jgi:hypothetical protein
MITTQMALRYAFWSDHPNLKRRSGWTQNQYPADVRQAWCVYVDFMQRDGAISEALAQRATL